jgi:hypothetical protein
MQGGFSHVRKKRIRPLPADPITFHPIHNQEDNRVEVATANLTGASKQLSIEYSLAPSAYLIQVCGEIFV